MNKKILNFFTSGVSKDRHVLRKYGFVYEPKEIDNLINDPNVTEKEKNELISFKERIELKVYSEYLENSEIIYELNINNKEEALSLLNNNSISRFKKNKVKKMISYITKNSSNTFIVDNIIKSMMKNYKNYIKHKEIKSK